MKRGMTKIVNMKSLGIITTSAFMDITNVSLH